jgi:polar amino acid transport system permease protein
MTEAFDIIRGNGELLAWALWVTIYLNCLSILVSLVFGVVVGTGREYGGWLVNVVLGFFVDVIRSIPILVIIIWTFFGLPLLLGLQDFSPLVAAVIALGVHSGAYMSEVVRGGLASVRQGQWQAGTALGMSWRQVMGRIILPQATIRMLPPISSRIIRNIKDSTLAATIAAPELFWAANTLEGETARPFAIYTTLMIFYFLLNLGLARGLDRVYARVAIRGRA